MATASVAVQPNENVTGYVTKTRKMLINGKWVDAASGKTFPTYNPATGEVLANVAEGDREDIDRAVKAARAAFETGPWSKISPSERGRMMWRLADLIEKHTEEFAQLESLDNGKPLKIARVADLPLAVDHFRYYAGWATKIEGNTIPHVPRAAGKISRLHRPRAGRRRRPDHSVEFPAADGGMETRPRARHRLLRRPQARRTNTAHRAASRRTDSGSWLPRWRREYRPRLRRNRRRRARPRILTWTRSRSPVPPKSAN